MGIVQLQKRKNVVKYQWGNMAIHDISKVIDLALDYNPMLATRDLSTIYAWVNSGCTVERDILPSMKEVIDRRHKMPNRDKINTFSYFTNIVLAARDKRLTAPIVEQKTRQPSKQEADEARAKHLKWVRDKKINLTTVSRKDFEWLADYENKKALSEERA